MFKGILIAALSIGVIGTGYWGYKEHQEKNAVLINAENNYQRAFHDLTYQIDQLNDKIGTTLAMNSKKSLSPALADVWRITSNAHNDVGQLPLTLLPFNKTEQFLSNIGDFSYRVAVRDLDKDPLSKKEYKTLQNLYEKSGEIQKELRKVQHLALENNLRWMDVELALASGQTQMDNSIIDGFMTVEKNVEGFSEADFGPSFTAIKNKDNGFKHLKGKEITKEEAKKVVDKFILRNIERLEITEGGNKENFEFYSATVHTKGNKSDIYLDITKKGGYPIYLMNNREVNETKISLNEASNQAIKFLKLQKFKDMELAESLQFGNVGVFSYVPIENGVRIYPDAIRMKVALDNAQVVAYSARDYLSAHRQREIAKPSLTEAQAKESINQAVDIQESRLALITNDLGDEVLCYEFLGTINNDTYRMYINANDGHEEKVEKLKNAVKLYQEI
jgi:spore germination protein